MIDHVLQIKFKKLKDAQDDTFTPDSADANDPFLPSQTHHAYNIHTI